MADLKGTDPVATLIGDVVASRAAGDRARLHGASATWCSAANAELVPLVPLRITVGDEFQGCFATVGEAVHATLWLGLHLAPDAQLRHGIGWGPVAVLAEDPRVEDGPGWWAAREAIDEVKLLAAKPATRHLRTAFRRAAGERRTGPEPGQRCTDVSGPDGWLCLGAVAATAARHRGRQDPDGARGRRGHLRLRRLAAGTPRRAGRDRHGRRAVEEGTVTWIAVLLIGVAVADLAHSIRPVPIVNECTGAAVAVWLGLLAGLTEPADLAALAVIAVAVVGYGLTVTRAFGGGRVLGAVARPRRLAAAGGALLGLGQRGGRVAGGLARRGAGPGAAGAPGRPRPAAPRGVPRAAEHRQRARPAGAGRDRHGQPRAARHPG